MSPRTSIPTYQEARQEAEMLLAENQRTIAQALQGIDQFLAPLQEMFQKNQAEIFSRSSHKPLFMRYFKKH